MKDRLPGLDVLRAVAIALVMISHAAVIPFTVGSTTAGAWRSCGPLGVDVFFALSGFLIGGILLETGERIRLKRVLGGFWLNRWLRTLPSYYLFLGVNVALWLWVYRNIMPWRGIGLTAVFLQNTTHAPGWFFMESWSLAVEEWFYLLVPLALFLAIAAGVRFRVALAGVLAVMLAGPLIRRALLPPPADWGLEIGLAVLNRIDAIGWGVAAVWFSRLRPEVWKRWANGLALVGALLIVECVIVANRPDFNRLWFSRVLFPTVQPLACALLLPWASCSRGLGVAQPVATAVARWSYSLYLINYNICILCITDVVPHSGSDRRGCGIAIGIFITVSTVLAAACYQWFERPVLRARARIGLCRDATAARMAAKALAAPENLSVAPI